MRVKGQLIADVKGLSPKSAKHPNELWFIGSAEIFPATASLDFHVCREGVLPLFITHNNPNDITTYCLF